MQIIVHAGQENSVATSCTHCNVLNMS